MLLHTEHTDLFLLIGKPMEGMQGMTMALLAWQTARMVWSKEAGACSG